MKSRFIFPLTTALQSGGCDACAIKGDTNCPGEKIVTITFFDGVTSKRLTRICQKHWEQLTASVTKRSPFVR